MTMQCNINYIIRVRRYVDIFLWRGITVTWFTLTEITPAYTRSLCDHDYTHWIIVAYIHIHGQVNIARVYTCVPVVRACRCVWYMVCRVCVCVFMHTCMYVCEYQCGVCMCVHLHVRACACMSARACASVGGFFMKAAK